MDLQHCDTPTLHYSVASPRLSEQLSCFIKEALAHRVLLAVAKVGEFLELGFLGRRQVDWHLDTDADVQIAAAIALDIPDAFALQAKHRAGLCARWNLDGSPPVQRWDLDFRAQRGLDETHRHFAKQIVAVALEEGMGLDMEHDVQIARRPAAKTGFAIAGGAQPRAGVHAGGNAQFDFRRPIASTVTAAGPAGPFEDAARAVAMRAGLRDAENSTRIDDLTAPPAT
jgi:hypothetical protein